MFLLMAISLFTSRIVLQTLGVEDFGIYNVVGGVVSMFSIFSSSLSSSISRFLTYELGKKDYNKLKTVFSTAINVQLAMATFIFIVAEVVGLWFLNNKMNIPSTRLDAANWVLHCSLLSFCINLISIPYNASIIAHEKMSAFAYISIVEAVLKLSIVYALWISPFDKLKAYATLMLLIAVILRLIYGIYCKRHFEECTYYIVYDKSLLKQMTGFAGWGFFGNCCWMFNTQGIDILINVFFGVTLNAARGIATQVERAVMQFVNNFMTALNPQITKSYAAGNTEYMHKLICWGAKYSYYLMLFFAIPICLETPKILHLWLGVVPDYAIDFVRLTFATSMSTILGNTLITAILATGKIRTYQIVVSIWGVLCFPLTWLAFKLGASPLWAYIIYFIIYFILIFIRTFLVKHIINPRIYVKDVILTVLAVTIVSAIPPTTICITQPESILRLIEVCGTSVLSIAISIYFIGMKANERKNITQFIKRKQIA